MATKKNSVQTSSTNSRPRSGGSTQSKGKGNDSASSMILQLIGGVVGDNLSESVSHLKTRVADQVAIHGEEYLESARQRIAEATDKVIEWGKKHPVKTVAAAAALIAVTGFLYATLHDKAAQDTKKVVAKMKDAAAKA